MLNFWRLKNGSYRGCGSVATKTRISKTGDYNRASSICTKTTTISVWLIAIIMVGTLLNIPPQIDAAPLTGTKTERQAKAHVTCKKSLIKPKNAASRDCSEKRLKDLFGDPVPWQNPCSSNAYNDTGDVGATSFNLKPLKRQLRSMTARIEEYGSCKTNETNWCPKSKQYAFFEYSRRTNKLCLRLEHKRLQVYVAGLSYLLKLSEDDTLKTIVPNALTLLCEIETAINQTARIKPPKPLRLREMCRHLNLQSLKEDDQTGVDIIFAKANFGKYLLGLNETLSHYTELPVYRQTPRSVRNSTAVHVPSTVSVNTTLSIGPFSRSNNKHSKTSRARTNRRKNLRKPNVSSGRNNGNRPHRKQRVARSS